MLQDKTLYSYLHTLQSQVPSADVLGMHKLPTQYYVIYKLLPLIVVQNRIRKMLGGELGNITFGRIKYKLGRGVKEFRFVYNIMV